jgi:hypothetical protein
VLGILLALFLIVAGIVFACALGILVRIRRLLRPPYRLREGEKSRPPSLVAWLNERLNTIAGLPADHPLTFGDLKASGITLRRRDFVNTKEGPCPCRSPCWLACPRIKTIIA